jgi:hypothetical protein
MVQCAQKRKRKNKEELFIHFIISVGTVFCIHEKEIA